MKRFLFPVVLALGGLVPANAQSTQATLAAAAPERLALSDLVQRPDRWPATVALARDFSLSGGTQAKAGQAVKVLEFNGSSVLIDAGNGLVFEIAPGDCDLVEAANKAWAALTPAQRAVDSTSLLEDASLWPERVICHAGFQLENGTVVQPGGEHELLYFDREGVRLYSQEHQTLLSADVAQTDLVARARQRALIEPDKRPSRVAAALKGALVDSAGQPYAAAAMDEAKLYVLYFGASWCRPCRKFSPGLVGFVNEAAKQHPRLATVLMSGDEQDADMLGYMQAEKMPWPAMPLAKLQKTPLFLSQSAGYIPHLVVLDRHGRVLASSVENGQYVGPDRALQALKELVEAGRAK